MTDRERLTAERDKAQAEIDAAYWTFTRCARGVPPALSVPDAYHRRNEANKRLREMSRSDG